MKFPKHLLLLLLLSSFNLSGQQDTVQQPQPITARTLVNKDKMRHFLWRITEIRYENGLKRVKKIQRRWFTGNLLILNENDSYPIRRVKVWSISGKLVSKITNRLSKSRHPKVRSVHKDYHENGRFKSKRITKRKKMDCMYSTLGEYRV